MGNAEASQLRILEAAKAEFAAYGIAGARVDRIAKVAQCNKNLIYIYFGDKEALFATVLTRNLRIVYQHLPLTVEDIPGYAAQLFDFITENPDLIRLLGWATLERVSPIAGRADSFETKANEIAKAQRRGAISSIIPPDLMITIVMSLAAAWSPISPFGTIPELDRQKSIERTRSTLVRVIATLVEGHL